MELGEPQSAIAQARSAISLFIKLNAQLEIIQAQKLLSMLAVDDLILGTPKKPFESPLSRREIEVIKLVAIGLNNYIIAERLFIGEHTVHRHLANILTKFAVGSRAAAVAHAAQLGLLQAAS
jgi:ATP/maltotriose-dependent transcriptional regulator MalT